MMRSETTEFAHLNGRGEIVAMFDRETTARERQAERANVGVYVRVAKITKTVEEIS